MAQEISGSLSVAYYASLDGASSHFSVKRGSQTIMRSVNQVATRQDETYAHLFAAAPAMLGQVWCAIEDVERIARQESSPNLAKALRGVAQMLRAVAAKAEGN